MSKGLQIVGAGFGRTGTLGLKFALEELLGRPCYHMREVLQNHPEHRVIWITATQGQEPDWDALFADYGACLDWPAMSFWAEISNHYADAYVLLSHRPANEWLRSMNSTILEVFRRMSAEQGPEEPRVVMLTALLNRVTPNWRDPEAFMAAYDDHTARVRVSVPPERLIDWQPGDGWKPICEKLGLPIPATEMAKTNTTEEFLDRFGMR